VKLSSVSVALLILLVLISSFAVIYSQHQSRQLFVQLQALQKQVDDLDIEWGRLQLEQSSWSSHGRIEKIAVTKLGMSLPQADKVVFIKE